jgi:signal peptidase I
MSTILAWFLSKRVRQVVEICRHVEKLVNHQRDLMKPEGPEEIRVAVAAVRGQLRDGKRGKEVDEALATLEKVANKHLKPYAHPSLRENLEVVLVAIAIALAVRTFFLQPFKIPTGSMQPTLFGITHENHRNDPSVEFPGRVQRFFDYWLRGVSYIHVVSRVDGRLRDVESPQTLFPFVKRQRIWIGDDPEPYTIWFPPEDLARNTGLGRGQFFRRGEDIIKARVVTGDHLFVDRLSYNFRRPQRGEIIVFETAGIPADERAMVGIPPDQFYIKRLVGLGGETLAIGDDRHVRVNGVELTASTPRFENVYTFEGAARDSVYSGHEGGARKFPTQTSTFTIRPKHYMVMGDNTVNSLDSRTWGDFPQEYVIGKASFVYWPILGRKPGADGRFGWGFR